MQGESLSEGNSKSHLWYAILLGDTCKYDDTRVKLTKGLEFEKQVKLSLDIDPYNSTALHLIGRYCFEVLSWCCFEVLRWYCFEVLIVGTASRY